MFYVVDNHKSFANMEKLCLKWNDFESNIRKSVKDLRNVQKHFDVTIATDDGFLIKAHKIVLMAGSNFFTDVFMQTNHSDICVYLKGIQRVELEYVIDFLYNGEAYIAQEELNKFLEIAQELQVKGLQSTHHDDKFQSEGVKESYPEHDKMI